MHDRCDRQLGDPTRVVPDDNDLLRLTAAGDVEAFQTFVRRYVPLIARFVRGLIGSETDSEDILQETFLAAWRDARTFRGDGSPKAWLFQIARNATFRSRRRHVGEPPFLESLDELTLDATAGELDAPRDTLDRLADRDVLERALGQLAKEDREVLLLRDVEGFSGKETAALLQLSLPAMKSRLHRARRRLMNGVQRESS